MELYRISILSSTLLCSLVAGFLFAFTVVVMPGIRNLDALDFLQAFKAMDRIIQNNQPWFILVWLGSIISLILTTGLSLATLQSLDRVLLVSACVIYLFGVLLPTAAINVPLNNRLQAQELTSVDDTELHSIRSTFESPWIKWNTIRTYFAVITSTLLILLVFRL